MSTKIKIQGKRVRETTLEHIRRVNSMLIVCANVLLRKAINHDSTKLEEPEVGIFEKFGNAFRDVPYGSPEYYRITNLPEFQEAVKHHHKHNPHHVEFFKEGALGMDLFDIIEMVCDWKAACERNPGGLLEYHIKVNFERFNIPVDLQKVILNTLKTLK